MNRTWKVFSTEELMWRIKNRTRFSRVTRFCWINEVLILPRLDLLFVEKSCIKLVVVCRINANKIMHVSTRDIYLHYLFFNMSKMKTREDEDKSNADYIINIEHYTYTKYGLTIILITIRCSAVPPVEPVTVKTVSHARCLSFRVSLGCLCVKWVCK